MTHLATFLVGLAVGVVLGFISAWVAASALVLRQSQKATEGLKVRREAQTRLRTHQEPQQPQRTTSPAQGPVWARGKPDDVQ